MCEHDHHPHPPATDTDVMRWSGATFLLGLAMIFAFLGFLEWTAAHPAPASHGAAITRPS